MVIVIALQLQLIMNYVVTVTNYLLRVQKCAGSLAKKIRPLATVSIGNIARTIRAIPFLFHFLFLRCSSLCIQVALAPHTYLENGTILGR